MGMPYLTTPHETMSQSQDQQHSHMSQAVFGWLQP